MVKPYPLLSVHTVVESIQRRGLFAAGVEIRQRPKRLRFRTMRPISPSANCAAMGLASVLSMRKGCAAFAGNPMQGRRAEKGNSPFTLTVQEPMVINNRKFKKLIFHGRK